MTASFNDDSGAGVTKKELKELTGKLEGSFYRAYVSQARGENRPLVKKRRIGAAISYAGVAMIAAAAFFPVVLAAGIALWAPLAVGVTGVASLFAGGIVNGNAVDKLYKIVDKAFEADVKNGTLLTRYQKEILPKEYAPLDRISKMTAQDLSEAFNRKSFFRRLVSGFSKKPPSQAPAP